MNFMDFLQFSLDNNYDIDWFGILGYTSRVDNIVWL